MTNMEHAYPQSYNLIKGLFKNPNYDDLTYIVEACRATAYQNIELIDRDEKFTIREVPLLFLGVLCDELSTWERFHASKVLSNIWSQQNFLESSDIILSSDPDIVGAIAHFKISNRSFSVDTMIKSLDSKLQDWSEVVRISIET